MATARAIQYARTLTPDDLRAVHFDIDSKEARALEEEWGRLGLSRLPLDIIECPDRRLGRAAIELVADATLDGDTECTVLLPRRGYRRVWQRFLHDRTADKIAGVLSQVPHVSATIIPYNLPGQFGDRVRSYGQVGTAGPASTAPPAIRRPTTERQGAATAPVDAEGRTGRWTVPAAGTARAGPRRCPTADDHAGRAGPGSPSPSPASSRASGSRWPAG